MLNLYRRHRATCKSSARRAKCSCPIWVQGVLRGESVRKSLDLTNWEAANRLVRDWEVEGTAEIVTARMACERFLSDRKVRETWTLAPVTTQKRLEMVRKFFTFCVDSDWIEKSPAKGVEAPSAKYDPTLPYTALEMEKILWAADLIREAHPKIPKDTPKKLKALILLMRYSGIRISDAVMFRREKLKNSKLFLRQAKTKQPV